MCVPIRNSEVVASVQLATGDPHREYAAEIFAALKQHGYNSHKIHWEQERATWPNFKSHEAVREYMQTIFERLGDAHAQISPCDFTEQMVQGTLEFELSSGYMKGNMAFVKIPTFFPEPGPQSSHYAAHANSLINSLKQAKPAAWAIDLRGNCGGTPSAMLLALQAFLPEGECIHFLHKNSKMVTWHLKEGSIWRDQERLDAIESTKMAPKICPEKILVLVDGETRSAAEYVVMALRTLPNVTVMGLPTLGLTTGVFWKRLQNGDSLFFSDSIVLDRNYKSPDSADGTIKPDTFIPWSSQCFF